MSFKTHLISTLVTASHLPLLALVLITPLTIHRLLILIAMGMGSTIAWIISLRRYHLIASTPTSRIATAPQGYVELLGRGDLHPGSLPLGYLSGPPCLWYRYKVSCENGGRIDSGSSDETFLIRDVTGTCVVDPDYAEILTCRHRSWSADGKHYKVDYLAPGDTLYVLGEMKSVGGRNALLNRRLDLMAMLKDWKKKPVSLLKQFDANGDGQIDPTEWETVKAAARQKVEEKHAEVHRQPSINVIRSPGDGKPFLLSNRNPATLAERYQRWSWFHLVVGTGVWIAALSLIHRFQ